MSKPTEEQGDQYAAALSEIKDFCEEREWSQFHNPKDIAIALSIQSIELVELFRWKSSEESEEMLISEPTRTKAEHEVADIAFFLLLFCKNNDINIWDALAKKMDINRTKYPIERVKGQSKKYNEYTDSDSLPSNEI